LNPARSNLTALVCSGTALLLLGSYTPGAGIPVCAFHWLTGRPCPLCGLTRGLFHIAKGHWTAAIGYHALSPLVLLMILAMFVVNLWPPLKRLPVPAILRRHAWPCFAALFLGYGVGRAFFMNSAMSFFN
jgi:hypothetical protein